MRALLAASVLGMANAGAAPPQTYPVQLSQRDRGLVAEAACHAVGAAGADQLKAFTAKRGSGRIQVSVQCAPHRTEDSLPVAHYTTCANDGGVWRCQTGYEAAQMRMPDAAMLAIRAEEVELPTAIELIREAQKLVYPPFHTPALWLMHGTCTVTRRPDEYSADFQRFGVACDAGSFAISKVCPGGRCGYFITQGGRKDD